MSSTASSLPNSFCACSFKVCTAARAPALTVDRCVPTPQRTTVASLATRPRCPGVGAAREREADQQAVANAARRAKDAEQLRCRRRRRHGRRSPRPAAGGDRSRRGGVPPPARRSNWAPPERLAGGRERPHEHLRPADGRGRAWRGAPSFPFGSPSAVAVAVTASSELELTTRVRGGRRAPCTSPARPRPSACVHGVRGRTTAPPGPPARLSGAAPSASCGRRGARRHGRRSPRPAAGGDRSRRGGVPPGPEEQLGAP